MIRKTIDLLTTAFLLASMVAAVPVSIYKPGGPGIYSLDNNNLSGWPVGTVHIKNAPAERQLGSGAP